MRRTKEMLIGAALDEFFSRPYVAEQVAAGRIVDTWRAVVGDAVANSTTEIRLDRRILHVKISSSLLRSEIFYQREALKDRLNEYARIQFVHSVIVK